METKDLIMLCYASAAATRLTKEAVVELLTRSRTNNARLGISGMLLYVDGSFLQILEGPADHVRLLFARIAQDERHGAVVKLVEEPIEARSFADWSMGYADVSRVELATIPGLNDFFSGSASFDELERGRAKVLLAAFREGRWRRRLSA